MSPRDMLASPTRPSRSNRIGRMLRHAGRAEEARSNQQLCEALEQRVLLAGDHPSMEDVFNTTNPSPNVVTLNMNGSGTNGVLATLNETDVMRFVPQTTDFVRVWADTLNVSGGSSLDSRVTIYTRSGPNNTPTLIADGSNNGILTAGPVTDGWVGFIAQAQQEYFVVVRSDQMNSQHPGSFGGYILRAYGTTLAGPVLNTTTGLGQVSGDLSLPGSDIVFRVTPGSQAAFISNATIAAIANPNLFDPRLDIYDAQGNHLTGNSDAGHLTDAFTVIRSNPNTTFYVRVRSDKLTTNLATGPFIVRIDGIAETISMNPVTRLGRVGQFLGAVVESHLWKFQAQGTGGQGTGLSIISLMPTGMQPINDSAIRLYNSAGTFIGFNELPGAASRLFTANLIGGETYYVVIENFNGVAGGEYRLDVESHHTFVPGVIDDHQSTPDVGQQAPAFGTPEWFDLHREFERATPVVWGDPQTVPIYPIFRNFPQPAIPGIPTHADPRVDHVRVRVAKAMGRIHTSGDTDLFQFVPPVDMLGTFDGHENQRIPSPPPLIAEQWAINYRPATRLQIVTNVGTQNGMADGWVNTQVRVLDSNFDVVYDSNDVVSTLGPDPAGMLSQAYWPPALNPLIYEWTFAGGQPAGIEVWGGETYYLEISGTGIGRYDVELMVDAEVDASGRTSWPVQLAGEGEWNSAYELQVDPFTGAARNAWFSNPNIFQFAPTQFTLSGGPHLTVRGRAMNYTLQNLPAEQTGPLGSGASINPGPVANAGTRGRAILETSDLAQLTSVTDKDLYMFRAIHSGYAEIWINTTQLQDRWFEATGETEDGNPMTPMVTSTASKSKTYNSSLDSKLLVFDNDFVLIGENNDNGITHGLANVRTVGTHGERTFFRRDSRVVIPVEAGKNYFIQVESGQLEAFLSDPAKVDWRHATGSYELLVNSMVDLGFVDDHLNWPGGLTANVRQFATPMMTDLTATGTTSVVGWVNGTLDSSPVNPTDTDTFTFISPGTGTAKFSLFSRDPFGSGNPLPFDRTLSIFNSAGALVGQAFASGTDAAEVNILATQGNQFYIVVAGENGEYAMTVTGVPHVDDHAEIRNWAGATVIDKDLYDYDGTETVAGRIENAGDTDVFAFESITFDLVTISVVALDASLSPVVDIYEVTEDPNGKPLLLRISHGATGTATFSVTAPPRTSSITSISYPRYYAVVSGADPNVHFGSYELTITVNNTTDDHPDINQWDLATETEIVSNGMNGIGSNSGVIETTGDTDLFQFVAPAQGTVTVVVTGATTMRPRVQIFDENHDPVLDEISGNPQTTGPAQANSSTTFTFTSQRNRTYFVVVSGFPAGSNTELGAYSVAITTPIPDDHPNVGEFEFATPINISSFSGNGAAVGQLEFATDSDLFTFTTIADGNVTISINAPGGIFNNFRPFLHLFRADESPIGVPIRDGQVPGDEDGIRNGRVVRTITGTTAGQVYYLMVTSDQGEVIKTGHYSVFVAGPVPDQGDDDHANFGDWANATYVPLNQLNGNAQATGRINNPTDTDLFFFTSIGGTQEKPRAAFVQVVTPAGQLLDVGVTIYTGNPQTAIASNTAGRPGANAHVEFDINSTNTNYWVLVSGLNGLEGDYTVRIDTAPAVYTLFYPEGFRSPNISEYVSIGNPSTTEDVRYTVRLRYEDPALGESIIASNVLLTKNTRGGITISNGLNAPDPGAADVPFNKPYAIIIESDGFIAANISHYDFNSTLGEAFTNEPSTTWSFAKGTKFPGQVNDFLVYYNPNFTQVRVTLTAYQPDGTSVAMSQIIDGNRRGGWNFNDTPMLPNGDFAFTVTSEPLNPGDEHIGIVAALSHYDLANSTGFGTLGDPNGGATAGILPLLLSRTSPTATSEVTFFNSSDTTAVIGIIGRYIGTALPNLMQNITLAPWTSVTLDSVALGMTSNQIMGLRYDANTKVTAMGGTRQFGATDVSQANTEAASSWFWGDAFINRNAAGSLYFENMYFYNPTSEALPITLNFQFNTGETRSHTFTVPAKDFATVALHQLQTILQHRVFNWFSVEATAASPFVAKLTHYDLVLNGGWGSRGAPLGLTNPVASI